MISLATVWLALCLALCVYAWYGQRLLIALPTACAMAALAIYAPTGTPRFTYPPAGHYAILGAKIAVNEAIYVLLDNGGVPVYYRLPYSDGKASELQNALDVGAQGGSVGVTINGDGVGGEAYDGEPPVRGDEQKQAVRPAVEVE